jgi:hypothetical protein
MAKLAAVTCEAAKPDKHRDRLIGDGDGLFLRVRPHGAKTDLSSTCSKGPTQNTPSASLSGRECRELERCPARWAWPGVRIGGSACGGAQGRGRQAVLPRYTQPDKGQRPEIAPPTTDAGSAGPATAAHPHQGSRCSLTRTPHRSADLLRQILKNQWIGIAYAAHLSKMGSMTLIPSGRDRPAHVAARISNSVCLSPSCSVGGSNRAVGDRPDSQGPESTPRSAPAREKPAPRRRPSLRDPLSASCLPHAWAIA